VLPLLMQRTEAKIVIDTACGALHEARIPVLTVHDSIIVPDSKKREAQKISGKVGSPELVSSQNLSRSSISYRTGCKAQCDFWK
jgi:hypothetical protein